MSGTTAFSRVLSLRDRKKSTNKGRLDINNLFSIDEKQKRLSREEERKVQDIGQRLVSLGITDVPQQRIEYALRSRSAQGDIKEALRLLVLYQDSVAGVLRPSDSNVKMLGAENREKTTCFLDALLFAMFGKSDVFEAILFNNFEDEPRKKLIAIMRLWVNLLRTGRLVPTDIVAKLQESLAECGWTDAAKIRQQDASEAFAFITDKLEMPLLTLRTDIYHAGKVDDKDDHKFITERMLDVAIPDNIPPREAVTLEMCLEEYFNNRVEVKRHLQRQTTGASLSSVGSRHDSIDKGGATFVETTEIDPDKDTPLPTDPLQAVQRPVHMRQRGTSIFSERKVTDERSQPKPDNEINPAARQRAASVKKEVLMPAWQFLNLIPWYADVGKTDNNNDVQVKQHFASKRPMLGICLKRYAVNQRGFSYRLGTHVDIPLEMATPHFAPDDKSDGDTSAIADVKLSLQSVVCHRGHSVDAGHYISFLRVGPQAGAAYGLPQNMSNSGTTDSSKDIWLRFDDLAMERVVVADIQRALQEESPYLLFYRVQPLRDDAEEPPPDANRPEPFDDIDSKLAQYSADEQTKESLEVIDWHSRRGSHDVSSPEEPHGRVSFNSARRSSLQPQSPESANDGSTTASIRTFDQMTTEPTTPYEERRLDPVIHTVTNNGRPPSSDGHQTANGEKRFSLSISRISSRLSGQKLNNPNIVVNEISDDVPIVGSPPAKISNHLSTVGKGTTTDHSPDGLRLDTKISRETKEKKRKFMSRSRRGSGQKDRAPDRECAVM